MRLIYIDRKFFLKDIREGHFVLTTDVDKAKAFSRSLTWEVLGDVRAALEDRSVEEVRFSDLKYIVK